MDLNDENDDSTKLVFAAAKALAGEGEAPLDFIGDARKATAAVLRELGAIQRPGWEDGAEWPDPDDLSMLADDIEGGGE